MLPETTAVVVDDDPAFAEMVAALLASYGVSHVTIVDTVEKLRALFEDATRFSIIISDFDLWEEEEPDMKGHNVLFRIHRHVPQGQPDRGLYILNSGHAQEDLQDPLNALGNFSVNAHFLQKPWEPNRLRQLVTEWQARQ